MRRRHAFDQAGLQRVLLVGGILVGLAGLGFTVWGLVGNARGLVVGPVLVAFAVACLVVSRDDGRGQWCPDCLARNPEALESCERCGAALD
ncbi:MAG TPA: hypothetical protein PLZ93_03830 [Nocardioides sp.]|uniref:hypothetical protein n=1 Tax=uncultured Nocardioides sp. TaxID=198441 RepID=UPI000EEFA88F|nr:hypothetical protein [uncultured Nocardioides sp.]HCB04397.1 hypothetical protein [Nocardioides sp.]HRD59890.1 hypothetical protein [Nocardioides sp.]HRI94721.1 hypothetical protein [Nocardioides sp.]HRK45584.1 hypothetical protein [Nocardioides sp.]